MKEPNWWVFLTLTNFGENFKSKFSIDSLTSSNRLLLIEMCIWYSGKVIVLTTMAKSGSTFLARMLQACDAGARNLLVLSEIDAFGAIALRIADFSITIQQARTLLLASLRFACKDQLCEQTIILRMRLPIFLFLKRCVFFEMVKIVSFGNCHS